MSNPHNTTGIMTFSGIHRNDSVEVHLIHKKHFTDNKQTGCWFVKDEGSGVIQGRKSDYLVPDLAWPGLAPGLQHFFKQSLKQATIAEEPDAMF